MKIKCDPKKFKHREDLLPFSKLSFKEKTELNQIKSKVNFDNEFIDGNGYCYLRENKRSNK